MLKLRILVVMLAVAAGLIAAPVFADHGTPSGVAATVTPGLVAVTVSEAAVSYGTVNLSTSSTLSTGEPASQFCISTTAVLTVTNSGNINANFNISGGNSFQDLGSGAISSIDGDGSTVTVVTSSSQGLTGDDVGSFVIIEGAGVFNGTFTINSVTPDITFTYGDDTNPVSPVTTGTWEVVGLSGADNSGRDLALPTVVSGSSINQYAHMYTTHGGDNATDPTACDFLGEDLAIATGTITSFLDGDLPANGEVANSTVVVSSSAHGLVEGDEVTISGSNIGSYNNVFLISIIGVANLANEFRISQAFVTDETGGSPGWVLPDDVSTDGGLTTNQSGLATGVAGGDTFDVKIKVKRTG